MRMHGLLFKPVINTRRHDFIVAIEEEEEKKKGEQDEDIGEHDGVIGTMIDRFRRTQKQSQRPLLILSQCDTNEGIEVITIQKRNENTLCSSL